MARLWPPRAAAAVLVVLAASAACRIGPAPTATPSTPTAITTPSPTPATALPEPSALGLDTVVKLSWAPVPGASGYFIYRDGNEQPLNPGAIGETTFEDIGLTNGRTYRYVVTAIDQNGGVLWRSAEIEATPSSH